MTAAVLTTAPDRDRAARDAFDGFVAAYGYEPDGVWSAPGRVNLIGEHVDYQDGLCLPMAISHRCQVAAARRPGNRIRVRSAQADGLVDVAAGELTPGVVDDWSAYALGMVWALEPFIGGGIPRGVDLFIDGQVPLGAGLSSSAALECAVGSALDGLFGLGLAGPELVEAGIRAETEFAGASTGGMDQAASVHSRAGRALLLDCRDHSIEFVPWDLAAQDLGLLIIDTRAPHRLVDGEYADRRRQSEQAARALGVATLREIEPAGLDDALARLDDEVIRRRARHVVTEIQRVRDLVALLGRGTVRAQLAEVARLLDASHDSLRDDYEVTGPELDAAVDAARAAGAHGARMTGGGFGGSAIALVEAAQLEDVARAVAEAFARRGFAAPMFFQGLPEEGAGQDR